MRICGAIRRREEEPMDLIQPTGYLRSKKGRDGFSGPCFYLAAKPLFNASCRDRLYENNMTDLRIIDQFRIFSEV
jgi:hypothetical protein